MTPEIDAESEEKRRIARLEEIAELETLLTKPQFRRFLNRVMARCRVFAGSVPGVHGADGAWFNEGKRSVGLYILAEVTEADPVALTALLQQWQGMNDGTRSGADLARDRQRGIDPHK